MIWSWWIGKTSRTWYAHGLVSLLVPAVAAAVADYLKRDPLLDFAVAATAMFAVYGIKEVGDILKHREYWNTDQGPEGVTYAVDLAGDLIGPAFVALTAWACYLLR